MALSTKFEKNNLTVTFNETKGNNLKNYEMYTEGIKVLGEVGRIATLKIVEAVARVNVKSLWKLGNSEKTGLPYNSINEWAITEFGFSKSHVSEILTVAKECCDPETGMPLPGLEGYGYTQLLAFTKNPILLGKVLAGEEVDGISLKSTAKEIKTFVIEDKQSSTNGNTGDNQSSTNDNTGDNQSDTNDNTGDNQSSTNDNTGDNKPPHANRSVEMPMEILENWHNILQEMLADIDAITTDENMPETSKMSLEIDSIVIELSKAIGLPF